MGSFLRYKVPYGFVLCITLFFRVSHLTTTQVVKSTAKNIQYFVKVHNT